MTNKFASRKFVLVLGTVLAAVGTALTGETTWMQSLWVILGAVLAYLGVEGARDIKLALPFPKE